MQATAPGVTRPTLLLVGTCDTKADEIRFLRRAIEADGGSALVMDVGVLAPPPFAPEVTSAEVAAAAGATCEQLRALGDENLAMTRMAAGAAALARGLAEAGRIHGMIALGGTMGTDLALEVAAALPLGMPKLLLSTVAFSHLIPPERVAPDLMMLLWAGGLYGLNSVCEAALRQAAGAALGAARRAAPPAGERPLVAMTSLGGSCLRYMVALKPALEARGYEVAVFHTTGMGGRAFESLAAARRFAAVLDLSLQEVSNDVNGSIVSSGPGRLAAAGLAGIPQIVAPGAVDMIDLAAWQPLPDAYAGRPYHAHNRLIASVTASADERRATAQRIAGQLARAQGPTTLILPRQGIQEWDRPGAPLHDAAGHAAFADELRRGVRAPVRLVEIDAHINDPPFVEAVLEVFDGWVAQGVVAAGAVQ